MNVLLGVTGSVATGLLPKLTKALLDAGHDVQIVTTRSARYFCDPENLPKELGGKERDPFKIPVATEWSQVRVWTDENEWFRQFTLWITKIFDRYVTRAYKKDDPILHIELRKWADVFVVAPLSANTLAKFANGICDNLLTCVFRAWDFDKPVVVAPAMNTFMWKNPWTKPQLDFLQHLHGSRGCSLLEVVPPQFKVLACGDEGIGAIADIEKIVEAVNKFDKTKETPASK